MDNLQAAIFPEGGEAPLLGVVLALVAGLGVLFFWAIGFFMYLNGYGNITFINAFPVYRFLFFAYPFVLIACILVGVFLYYQKQRLPALAVSSIPFGGTVAVYLIATIQGAMM